jgi:hypothetical protein
LCVAARGDTVTARRLALIGRGSCSALGHPAARIAGSEVVDPGVDQRTRHERSAMRREREDVGDDAAIGEDLGRLAQRIDERVVEPAPAMTSRTWAR